MKFWILTAAALVLAPAAAEAAHCKALSQAHAEYKKLSQQADRAEKRDDYATACKLRKKSVKVAERMVGMKADCFHGGREQFKFLATSARALEDMACNFSAGEDFLSDMF
jgi:hypothetical protein